MQNKQQNLRMAFLVFWQVNVLTYFGERNIGKLELKI